MKGRRKDEGRKGGRWHRPEMDEKDGRAVSEFNSDAIYKVIGRNGQSNRTQYTK